MTYLFQAVCKNRYEGASIQDYTIPVTLEKTGTWVARLFQRKEKHGHSIEHLFQPFFLIARLLFRFFLGDFQG